MPPVSVGPRAPEQPPAEPPVAPPQTAPPAPAPDRPPAPTRPSTAPPTPPGSSGRFIVLNFDNADIETVIHAASEIVGFNYVLAPDVRGKVTVQTSGRIPQEDVFGVLLGILEVHGFTAVKAGNLYKIVRLEGARERAVPTVVGDVAVDSRNADEIITQIIPIRHASVNDLGVLLRPFVSSRGTLVANRETNVLVVTDAVANIRRVLDIVKLVDVQVSLDEVQIIPVAFADATEVATILNQLFVGGRLRAAAPGTPVAPSPQVAPGAPAGPAGAPTATERPPLVIAERRSNSIVVHGRRSEIETIRRILSQLDVNVTGGRRVFIYFAENAKSKDLTATLNAIYGAKETVPTAGPTPPAQPRTPGQPPPLPGAPPTVGPGGPIGGGPGLAEFGLAEGQFRFIADETTNSVIVTTTPRQWTDIEPTIKQLDKMPRQVLIEVLVAEITLQDDTKLGVDWALKTGSFRFVSQSVTTSTSGPPGITAPTGLEALGSATAVAGLPGAGLTAFAFATDQFFAMLNALSSENRVNVISNPHVMTSENKKAVVNVSTSIPIVTSQQTGTLAPVTTAATPTVSTTGSLNQTVEYRDAGVVLTVTPRIGERGTVALEVKQEVNDIGDPEPPTGSRRINKREAETSVVLMNNQTLVMAGLIQERRGAADRGIPIVNRIPFLGFLFGFKQRTVEKRELILLITPRVVGTPVDAQRITDQMRHATPELDNAVRHSPRAPVTAPIPPPSTPPTGVVVPSMPEPPPTGVPPVPATPPTR
ncbi:MAG TPA: type II secretion system secretin GspD [Methylomirabilota bacterium]|nr:type II secretion system secretin GspD [Methylomirabilota bacterium]